jgi:hypothetical protein
MSKSDPGKTNPHAAKPAATGSARQSRTARPSIILSAIAVAGIVVFLTGAVLTVVGFFVPQGTVGSFTGQAWGMKVTTTNAGLALAFLGALFVGLVRVLRPAAGVLFYEKDGRTWIERTPPWLGPAFLLLAFASLAALIVMGVRG